MTPDDLRALRRKLGFTQVDLARALRVSPNTVARWEQGIHAIAPVVQLALMHLERTYGDRGTMISDPEYRRTKPGARGRPFSPAAHVWQHPAYGEHEPQWEEQLNARRRTRRTRKAR